MNKVFDIVAVTKTRITKKTLLTFNINLQNYSFEFMATESNAVGTLLYIANHLSYKLCTDLKLNIANQMEPTFLEIISSKKKTLLVAFINILIWMVLTLIKILLTPFLIN